MKRCENCFEDNSDGATNCVICGEALDVPQVLGPFDAHLSNPQLEQDSTELETGGDEEGWDTTSAAVDRMPGENRQAMEDQDSEGGGIAIGLEEEEEEWEPEGADFDVPEMELVTPVEDEGWDDEGALFGEAADEEVAVEAPAAEDDSQGAPSEEHATAASFALEIYHDTEARVVHTHPVVNDITLIGREDPHRDIFPDLDLGKLADDGVSAQHVSRQHLRLLRQGERCYLFIYKGTTGTQVCKEVIEPSRYGKRFEINVGDRIILGGKVRMKLTAGEPDA